MTAHHQAPWTGEVNYDRRLARLDNALIATANEFSPTARPPRFWALIDAMDRLAATKDARNGVVARPAQIAFKCPECGQSWTVDDDPNGWTYGHDCEATD